MKNNVKFRKYKPVTLVALCVAVLLCLASCTGGNKASDAEGTCGGGVDWSYDASDRTLEIKGKGVIPAYKSSSEVPWAAAIESIQKIELDDGITSVGSYAFYGCSQLKEAELPASLTEIGDFAFAYCTAVEKLEIPEAVSIVGASAFEGC